VKAPYLNAWRAGAHLLEGAGPMRRIRLAVLALLLGFSAVEIAHADEAAAWAALRAGGHVALMRHTDAPGGTGDPPGFRLGDCASQRNLSAKGRADAHKIGARLKAEGIVFERILASPWCRCMDTAAIMKMGMVVEAEPEFSNVVVLSDQKEALTAAGRAIIEGWKEKGLLLVVTHGANIFALTGISPATGEIVVVRSGSEVVGRLRLE
jgi:phosphohistidine phosphatase SixA